MVHRAFLVLVILLTACATPRPGTPTAVYHRDAASERLNLPFSEAARVGNVLYLSGAIGVLPGTLQLAPGGIQPETRQTLENIKAVLHANHSSLDRVFKCMVMLADIAEWPAMNEIYREYLSHKPARSAFAATGLALGARVEIECMATVP